MFSLVTGSVGGNTNSTVAPNTNPNPTALHPHPTQVPSRKLRSFGNFLRPVRTFRSTGNPYERLREITDAERNAFNAVVEMRYRLPMRSTGTAVRRRALNGTCRVGWISENRWEKGRPLSLRFVLTA